MCLGLTSRLSLIEVVQNFRKDTLYIAHHGGSYYFDSLEGRQVDTTRLIRLLVGFGKRIRNNECLAE